MKLCEPLLLGVEGLQSLGVDLVQMVGMECIVGAVLGNGYPSFRVAEHHGVGCLGSSENAGLLVGVTAPEFMAEHPDEGDVVQGSGGVRKVRWSRAGSGKSGGVRVIYFVRNDLGELVLLFVYAKSKMDSLKASTLKELRDAVK